MAVMRRLAVLAAAVALAAACARPGEAPPAGDAGATGAESAPAAARATGPGDDGARAAIDAINAETGRLVAAGDGAAVGRQYAADGEVLPAHRDAIRGPAAIGRSFQDAIDAGLRGLALTAEAVESHGDTAIERGSYVATGPEGRPLDRGKYLVVWRRGPEGWLRHRDISTTSLPAPPAGAGATPAAAGD